MANISINISDYTAVIRNIEREVTDYSDRVTNKIADTFMEKWRSNAAVDLRSTRSLYINSMEKKQSAQGVYTVGLKETDKWSLPEAIEEGMKPFDMKRFFAKSSKKKTKKNGGWYLVVPFEHGTPNRIGSKKNPMPSSVYKVALKIGEGKLKIADIPKKYKVSATQLGEGVVRGKYRKTSLYEGLQRQQKLRATTKTGTSIVTGEGFKTNRGFITFRTVSDKSPQYSWIHPGIMAHQLMKKTLDELDIERIANKVK